MWYILFVTRIIILHLHNRYSYIKVLANEMPTSTSARLPIITVYRMPVTRRCKSERWYRYGLRLLFVLWS